MEKKNEPPKVEFIGKLNVERAMKMLLDLEAQQEGLVPIDGTFHMSRRET